MDKLEVGIAAGALLISIASFVVAYRASLRAQRAEAITHLLGNKETVAFAALKVLRDGLPKEARDRKLLLAAITQACVFSSSDRARALLYRVIELNRSAYGSEFLTEANALSQTFASTEKYQFEPEDLDLGRGKRRMAGLLRVIEVR